jgi:hypothetical protein
MRKRVVLLPCRPASVFVLLSLSFGSIIIFYQSAAAWTGRDSTFSAHLFSRARRASAGHQNQSSQRDLRESGVVTSPISSRPQGKVFARARDEGVRYGQIMAEYSKFTGTLGYETERAALFAPFAGTEGYNTAAYVSYIVAAAIGRLLRLDFPAMLLLMWIRRRCHSPRIRT